ncbi:LysR substrate-binding domain-containing protein [Vibrio olivae]
MPIVHRNIPSLSSLITFESAARLGNLTRAADELCVSPTAASKQIKKLEEFLNTQLFIRSKQGVTLTAKGEEYLGYVTEALELLSATSSKMDDSHDVVPLNVEIGSCFSHFWLLPRLDDFRNRHPDILLNLVTNNERHVGDNSDYDVAFFYSSMDSVNKNNHLMFAERIVLVCSPAFEKKYPHCSDVNQLWQLPILQLKEPLSFWEGWETWATLYGVELQTPENVIQVEDQVSVIHAAVNDAGIALAWDWQVRDLLESGQLVAITEPVDFNNAFFLSISEQSQHPASQLFVDWVIGAERRFTHGV